MKKKRLLILGIGVALLFWLVRPGLAIDLFNVGANPVQVMGYISQQAGFGIAGEHYDTQKGFQSALTQLLLETQYSPRSDLKFFVSGNFTADWAYPILGDNNKWEEKKFDKSRDRLFILDDWQDLLKEANVTWASEHFFIRAGKQIVSWGETDGFLLMNQINPIDQRRGIGDVQFESTIIPIWLLRAEYNPRVKSSWMQDLGFQFIFNPNPFGFRGNETIRPGNTYAGIWAPNITILGPFPFGEAHLGELLWKFNKPATFNPEGYDYGLRVKSVIWDSIITLSGFYGRDRDFVTTNLPFPPGIYVSPYDGELVINPQVDLHYPRFKFVGATFTRDFEKLQLSFLGGVAPVIRLEALYAFDSTYGNSANTLTKTDEFRGVFGVDWKVKIPILNPRAYFFISAQYFYQKIMDYPSGGITLSQRASLPPGLDENNHKATVLINTTYLHNKLQPLFFWYHDFTNRADFFKLQVGYEQSSHWYYTLGAIFLSGNREGRGFQVLNHKDQLYATITYKF
jgi:Protein of unknown function (DUF1302)